MTIINNYYILKLTNSMFYLKTNIFLLEIQNNINKQKLPFVMYKLILKIQKNW